MGNLFSGGAMDVLDDDHNTNWAHLRVALDRYRALDAVVQEQCTLKDFHTLFMTDEGDDIEASFRAKRRRAFQFALFDVGEVGAVHALEVLVSQAFFCKEVGVQPKIDFLFDAFDDDGNRSLAEDELVQMVHTCANGIALLLEQPPVPHEFLREFTNTALHLSARRHMSSVEFLKFVTDTYPNMTELMETGVYSDDKPVHTYCLHITYPHAHYIPQNLKNYTHTYRLQSQPSRRQSSLPLMTVCNQ
jgi:hypothetical protein